MEKILLDILENISIEDYKKFCWFLKNQINCQFSVDVDNRCELISFLKTKFSIEQIGEYFKAALKEANFNYSVQTLTEKMAGLNDPKKELEILKKEVTELAHKISLLEDKIYCNDLNFDKKDCVKALSDLTEKEFHDVKFYLSDDDFMHGFVKLNRSQLHYTRLEVIDKLWNGNGQKIRFIFLKACEIVKSP
ncbi:hypothetical protein LCDVSa014R [Lymphocystis disease virus 3]|uniref:Uncharacterized protein n=1 Tax=Lymphocystis disease virus 3 TaxID=2560566 RepID=A0A1B2RVS8_9VIRU|nr:hypothetical protein BZK12_gp014 [Lymphocystis disease virus Sa]AOC55098.1 hypothetical protein LCDVSa014R [Lymphocystis disease virus 3]